MLLISKCIAFEMYWSPLVDLSKSSENRKADDWRSSDLESDDLSSDLESIQDDNAVVVADIKRKADDLSSDLESDDWTIESKVETGKADNANESTKGVLLFICVFICLFIYYYNCRIH